MGKHRDMLPTERHLTEGTNETPFEDSVKAFMESLHRKAALTEEIRLAEELNKQLILDFKQKDLLSMAEAEALARSYDHIEVLKEEHREVTDKHKSNETALSNYLEKIQPKKVAYPYNELTYELHFSTLKGVQCHAL